MDTKLPEKDKIVLFNDAGLVGQNFVILFKENGYNNIVVIDKHESYTEILKNLQGPSIKSCIDELPIADTCVYYREDRSISESVRIGKKLAEAGS